MKMNGRKRGFGRRWTPETSALAHEAKARKRMQGLPPEYPSRIQPGTPLHTIRIESHLRGMSVEIVVLQARRANQVVVRTFGRQSHPHGLDWLCQHIRKRLLR